MSQVTAMTTGGPGSKKTCHIPHFNANLKATNAMRMQEAGGCFSKRPNAGKEVDGKRGQKEKWKRGEIGNIIISTTKRGRRHHLRCASLSALPALASAPDCE